MRSKDFIKILIGNVGILLTLLIAGEFFSRSFFNEFKGDYYSKKITRGIKTYSSSIDGINILRAPNSEFNVDKNSGLFVITGDSITYGFGIPYEEIYWVRMQRKYELSGMEKLTFLPIAGYGARLDIVPDKKLTKVAKSFKGKNKTILYQFNMNDVYPFSETIKRMDADVSAPANPLQAWRRFRWSQMNKSVFFRVLTHYAGIIKRQSDKNKKCDERGLNSLGAYTWSYGSKQFKSDSEKEWLEFEIRLANLKKLSQEIKANLVVFISPILYDIDEEGVHPHYNTYGLDFSCATINPRDRLNNIANKLSIRVIDPTSYLKKRFEALVEEDNFKPFFFATDDNHITSTASVHLSDFLFYEIFKPFNK